MKFIKQSTSVVVAFGPAVSSADGFTPQTGLVGTTSGKFDHATTGIFVSKNGAPKAVRHATVTASVHNGDGEYGVTLDATDTNTLGRLRASFPGSATLLPIWEDFTVLVANVYDSLIGNADQLMVDVSSINNVAGDAVLLAAMVESCLTGTVSSTGADATHLQFTDITEATAAHYVGKEAFIYTGAQIKQRLGVVTAYTLTSGQGRFTFSQGTPTAETPAAGTLVFFA